MVVILFAEPTPRPAARATDPASSVEAESKVTRSGMRKKQARLIAELIRENYTAPDPLFRFHPELSFTAGELAKQASRWSIRFAPLGSTEAEMRQSIQRRLSDLRAAGEVYNKLRSEGGTETRQCKVRGTRAQMWWRRGPGASVPLEIDHLCKWCNQKRVTREGGECPGCRMDREEYQRDRVRG